MGYQIHDLEQGSEEWLAHRSNCLNASDLSAARACSKYKSRNELIREMSTGVYPEIDAMTQKRFDDGHRFEALARIVAEKIVNEDLYPITVSENIDVLSRKISASLDGATASDDINFEHKTLNKALSVALGNGVIPEEYHPQMDQGMMINGAKKTLFMASKWDDNDELIEEKHLWYEASQESKKDVIRTWQQIEEDVDNYQYVEPAIEDVGKSPESLPALRIEVTGMVTDSNLLVFKETSLAVIGEISTDLQTDIDFADAEKAVKWCSNVESRLDAAKDHALSQTVSIDELFRTIDEIKEIARQKRLEISRLVKSRKESIRFDILKSGKSSFDDHINSLNQRIGKNYMPEIQSNFSMVMKGKKTVSSLRDAVDSELARVKIEANAVADKIQNNLNTLRELAEDYKFLFSDVMQIITKENDDLTALVKLRIADHKEAEEARLQAERDRIRQEEEQRAKAEQERIAAKAEQEAERIRDEETAEAERIRKAQQTPEATEAIVTTVDAAPLARQEIDKEVTENNIRISLINNGIGPQSAKKIAKLLVDGKITDVSVVYATKIKTS